MSGTIHGTIHGITPAPFPGGMEWKGMEQMQACMSVTGGATPDRRCMTLRGITCQ